MKRHSNQSGSWAGLYLILAVLVAMFMACSTPPDNPREITGTFEAWPGGTGSVRLELPQDSGNFLAQAQVTDAGAFTLKLPDTVPADLLTDLSDGDPLQNICPGLNGLQGVKMGEATQLEVTQGAERYWAGIQASSQLPTDGPAPIGSLTIARVYVNKAVRLEGQCNYFNVQVDIDVNLNKGWNNVIAEVVTLNFDGIGRLSLKSGPIPAGVKWFLWSPSDFNSR